MAANDGRKTQSFEDETVHWAVKLVRNSGWPFDRPGAAAVIP